MSDQYCLCRRGISVFSETGAVDDGMMFMTVKASKLVIEK